MPKRGSPGLWWMRILTDFGKDEYVLGALAVLLIAIAIIVAGDAGNSAVAVAWSGNASAVPVLSPCWCLYSSAKSSNGSVGRGRPFVGGDANVFNFSHFAGTRAYSSFPSGHSITAAALAFAVGGAVAKGEVRDDRLCPHHSGHAGWCCWPIIQATWSRARWSASSARCSYATGLRPAGSDLRSTATAPSCRWSDPRRGASKGLPGAHSPHKKRTPRSARHDRFRP